MMSSTNRQQYFDTMAKNLAESINKLLNGNDIYGEDVSMQSDLNYEDDTEMDGELMSNELHSQGVLRTSNSTENNMDSEDVLLNSPTVPSDTSANPPSFTSLSRDSMIIRPTPSVDEMDPLDSSDDVAPFIKNPQMLTAGLQTVNQDVKRVTNNIRQFQSNVESLLTEYMKCQLENVKECGNPTNLSDESFSGWLQEVNKYFDKLAQEIGQSMILLMNNLEEITNKLTQLQSYVLNVELNKWKREQQLGAIGILAESKSYDDQKSKLDIIQEWCETIIDSIWTSRQHIQNLEYIFKNATFDLHLPTEPTREKFKNIIKKVTKLLHEMVASTFIIVEQPPQVLFKNRTFLTTIRFLVGDQLALYLTPPRVGVTMISHEQLQLVLKNKDKSKNLVFDQMTDNTILNNTCAMEYNKRTRQLSASFKNLQLTKIKRNVKKGTNIVADEKQTLVFYSQFNVNDVGGENLDFKVWELSLPVVPIVHGTRQEPQAWGTVMWDNLFCMKERRSFFQVPDKVSWGQLAKALKYKFFDETGRELTIENVRVLAEKLLGMTNLTDDTKELDEMPVTWSKFCKEDLPGQKFTFLDWFFGTVKVTKLILKDINWRNGLIMGFVQKEQAYKILETCVPGAFLIRFADSQLGGVSCVYKDANKTESYLPFTTQDLKMHSLANRVLDLPKLKFLYQSSDSPIPKEKVFKYYYTKSDTVEDSVSNGGYKRTRLVVTEEESSSSQGNIATVHNNNSPMDILTRIRNLTQHKPIWNQTGFQFDFE